MVDYEELENDDFNQTPQLHEHFRCKVDKGQSLLRIDKYLFNCMAGTSRNRIQEAADAGNILVNGKSVKSSYRVKPNDEISLVLAYPPTDYRIGLVHRIDKDTSGLLQIAKTPEAKTNLGQQFFVKSTQRTYNALVWGVIKEDEGTINAPLARDPHDRMLFTVFKEGENPLAKHAVTHYKVLERFAFCTLVECRLETGRTHQIRVHMKSIGHTLFNDDRYGGNDILKGLTTAKYRQFIKNCFEICPRQALHAKTLGFTHPTTGKFMQFDSELPDDMTALLEKWRRYSPAE